MAGLDERELRVVDGYCALLAERLGGGLVQVALFGSAARDELWPAHSPMHSDVDLLVVTRDAVPEPLRDELVDATYPLFLECGRQISPAFVSQDELARPADAERAALLAGITADARRLWPGDGTGS